MRAYFVNAGKAVLAILVVVFVFAVGPSAPIAWNKLAMLFILGAAGSILAVSIKVDKAIEKEWDIVSLGVFCFFVVALCKWPGHPLRWLLIYIVFYGAAYGVLKIASGRAL